MNVKKSTRIVRISHGQSFKQSKDWQSMDASYNISIEVNDDPESIKEGIARVERLVEKALIRKSTEQRQWLNRV